MRTLLVNGRLISPGTETAGGALLLEDRRIAALFAPGETLPPADRVEDLQGSIVMPGFIDVHCHGRGGDDFTDGEAAAVARISQEKLREGVTTLLPTSLTLPLDKLLRMAEAVRECVRSGTNGCKLPGLHLEGPYLAPDHLGAQNPAYARTPSLKEVLQIHAVYPVRKVTFAPELPGGDLFAAQLKEAGIVPSGGHSGATYAQFLAAYRYGLRDLTHFGNQMTKLHHREIGLVGAGLLHQDVFLELICDLRHLSSEMIKLVFQTRGLSRLQLITDALRCTGMPDGRYEFGGVPFTLRSGEARLDGGALAGSTLTMDQALRNVRAVTDLPLTELVQCTALAQAQSLDLPHTGRLAPGFDADLVILNEELEVTATWVDGVRRFQR